MSAAPASVSRPSWKTVAASASEASAARAFRVATPTRSQSASTASGDWPWPASQLPKERSSVVGSAGSTDRSARAARAVESRALIGSTE